MNEYKPSIITPLITILIVVSSYFIMNHYLDKERELVREICEEAIIPLQKNKWTQIKIWTEDYDDQIKRFASEFKITVNATDSIQSTSHVYSFHVRPPDSAFVSDWSTHNIIGRTIE